MNLPCMSGDFEAKALKGQESPPLSISPEIQEEIRKYVRMLPEVPEPNLVRVREIKEQIQQGNYLTREIIEETAGRLALRFLRKE